MLLHIMSSDWFGGTMFSQVLPMQVMPSELHHSRPTLALAITLLNINYPPRSLLAQGNQFQYSSTLNLGRMNDCRGIVMDNIAHQAANTPFLTNARAITTGFLSPNLDLCWPNDVSRVRILLLILRPSSSSRDIRSLSVPSFKPFCGGTA